MVKQILLIGLGGFVGSVARFYVSRLNLAYDVYAIPLGTLTVNILGKIMLPIFKKKLKQDPDLQGIVQCDTKAEVGRMVHLIDLLRQAGVKKYAIATEQPPKEEG